MPQTPYLDLDNLKAYLNIANSNSSQDVFLTNLIPSVQGFVDRYTHRTFGWGDTGDSPDIDYSNSDSIAILSSSLNGALLTINTAGPIPWVINQLISVWGIPTLALNGVWKVTQVINPSQIIVDTSVSQGTLSLTNQAYVPTGQGFIGNFVSNYKYISQESQDGFVQSTFYLRNMDIRSIDSVYLGLRNLAKPTLLNHTQYAWRDDGRVIVGGSYFDSYNSDSTGGGGSFYGAVVSGFQTITVSYWIGYVSVPPEISLAVADLCTAMYAFRKSLGIREERVGDYQVYYDVTLRKLLKEQPDTLNVLNLMRRRHI